MSRIYKQTPLQRHLNAQKGAINNSNKAQLKKINKIKNFAPREQVPLSDFYMLVDKIWVHKGRGCRLCGSILSDPVVLDKHRYICNVLNKKEDVDNMPEEILTIGRKINTPKGIFTMREAQKYYGISDQTIRNRIKNKTKGWSYADTSNN